MLHILQLSGYQSVRGEGRDGGAGVKYTVKEGELTLGDGHTMPSIYR